MKLLSAIILGASLSFTNIGMADESKDVTVKGKTYEVRVPKSAKIDCKKKENLEKIECKKQPKEMPKVDKPKETAPADSKKK